jgi:CheY-like chemotaxis protein
VSAKSALRTQTAIVRTLAHELRRERSERPEMADDLQGQVLEESVRLASTISSLTSARLSQPPIFLERERAEPGEALSEPRRRILIVEDDEQTRAALSGWLGYEYEVMTASDGCEGLALASQITPDIIVTDLWMPKLDGISMVNRMMSVDSLRNVPVVFLTGQTEPASIAASFSAGGHSYLTKPVDLEMLEDEIRSALSGRPLASQNAG